MSLFPFICLVAYTTQVFGARITNPSEGVEDWETTKKRLEGFLRQNAHANCGKPKSVTSPSSFWKTGLTTLSCERCNSDSVMFKGPHPFRYEADAGAGQERHFFTAQDLADVVSIEIKNHCSKFDGEASKKVIMIRHGQSKWNKVTEEYGVIAQAWGMQDKYIDSPLSQDGLRQAQRFAMLLRDAETEENIDKLDDNIDTEKEENEVGKTVEMSGSSRMKPVESRKTETHPLMMDNSSLPVAADAASKSQVHLAMKELSYMNLDRLVLIKNKGTTQTNAALVDGLRNHKEELQVLLGKKCSETAFVTSQLTRAIDTFNIAMLPARLNCDFPFEVSSNLQEFEHNKDCEARNSPGKQPTVSNEQRDEYIADQMGETLHYMREQYGISNNDRFTRNLDMRGRQRIIASFAEHKETIKSELDHIFSEASVSKKFILWGGHSIWFRFAFKFFGDQQDPTCVQLGKVKIANVGVVSATLRKVHDSETPYAFVDCNWVHLGPSDEYKYKFDSAVMSHEIPRPMDFRFGAEAIVGWKCCCPTFEPASLPTLQGIRPRKSCLLVRSDHGNEPMCGDSNTWHNRVGTPDGVMNRSDYSSWSSRYGWLDDRGRPECHVPGLGTPVEREDFFAGHPALESPNL